MFRNYKIVWRKSATKFLDSLSRTEATVIVNKVEELVRDADSVDLKKLQGYKSLYRVRNGDYRIVVEVFKGELIICVIAVGHRRDIYSKIKLL